MKRLISILCFISLTACSGQKQTLDEKIISAQNIASEFLEDENIPGLSISVSKDENMIWSEGFGYANITTKEPVNPATTLFRIASISKSLTALALGRLMDSNVLDLDESIYTYVPDFPKKEYDFTVRQVGGHIAGIRHYNGNEFILNKKMSIVEGLDIFKDSPLKFKPGTRYSYSTYGWNLLSVVIQNASKREFNSFMTDQIFKPLGMSNTQLDVSDKVLVNRTQFYREKNNNAIVLGPEVSNEFKVAGGGFLSTSEDLIAFGNEIISPKLVSKKSIAELLKPQKLSSGKKSDHNYGVGFRTRYTVNNTPVYSHSGGGIGASTLLLMYPKEGVVISILTNKSNAPVRDLSKALERIFIN